MRRYDNRQYREDLEYQAAEDAAQLAAYLECAPGSFRPCRICGSPSTLAFCGEWCRQAAKDLGLGYNGSQEIIYGP